MGILLGWAINAGVLLLIPYLVPAVHIAGFGTALVVALVLGLLNILIRPVLLLLTLPVNLLTLGLFTFVINGFLFWLAARWLEGFSVDGFWWAVLAAFLYSVITAAVAALLLARKG